RARARDRPLPFELEGAHAAGDDGGRAHRRRALQLRAHALRPRPRGAAPDGGPFYIYLHGRAGLIRATIADVHHPREVAMLKRSVGLVALAVALAIAAPEAQRAKSSAAPNLTTPKEQFGWGIGDDYRLVTYTQYVEYLKKLDQQSDRMTVVEIGKTEEGRPELTAIITSPENHKKLAHYKEINRK